ncbi:MAG: hypothetical protein GEU93_00425 [Propionibacteriales bacterium]|nr:hypothetical protein [Propionibacteriales bacterium]
MAYLITVPLLGIELAVAMNGQSPMTIGLLPVVVSSLVAALAGWAALAGLERLTARARPIWAVIAVLALLVSLVPPVSMGESWSARVALSAMHILVAAVLIPGLPRRGPSVSRS